MASAEGPSLSPPSLMTSSSNAGPPQLHLSIPPNTTSFKRTFEQFDFDLEDSNATPGASGSNASVISEGRERRGKRARSSESSEDDRSEGSTPGSYGTARSSETTLDDDSDVGNTSGLSATRPLDLHPVPPQPFDGDGDVNMQINVSDEFRSLSPSAAVLTSPSNDGQDALRSNLERFTAFDAQISALRRSRSPVSPQPLSPVQETIFDADQTSSWQESPLSPWDPAPTIPSSPPRLPTMTFGSGDSVASHSANLRRPQQSSRSSRLRSLSPSHPPSTSSASRIPTSGLFFITDPSDSHLEDVTPASHANDDSDFGPTLLSDPSYTQPAQPVQSWNREGSEDGPAVDPDAPLHADQRPRGRFLPHPVPNATARVTSVADARNRDRRFGDMRRVTSRSSPSPERLEVGLSDLFGTRDSPIFRRRLSPSSPRERNDGSEYRPFRPGSAAGENRVSSPRRGPVSSMASEPLSVYPPAPRPSSSLREPGPSSPNRQRNSQAPPPPSRRRFDSPTTTRAFGDVRGNDSERMWPLDEGNDLGLASQLVTDADSSLSAEPAGPGPFSESNMEPEWLSGSDSSDEVVWQGPASRQRPPARAVTTRPSDQDESVLVFDLPPLGTRAMNPGLLDPSRLRERRRRLNELNTTRNYPHGTSTQQPLSQSYRRQSDALRRTAAPFQSSAAMPPHERPWTGRSSDFRYPTYVSTTPSHRPSLSASVHPMLRPNPREGTQAHTRSTSTAPHEPPRTTFTVAPTLLSADQQRAVWRRFRPGLPAEQNRDLRLALHRYTEADAHPLWSSTTEDASESRPRGSGRDLQEAMESARRQGRERIAQRVRSMWRERDDRGNTTAGTGAGTWSSDEAPRTVPTALRVSTPSAIPIESLDASPTNRTAPYSVEWMPGTSEREFREPLRSGWDTGDAHTGGRMGLHTQASSPHQPTSGQTISPGEQNYIQFLRDQDALLQAQDRLSTRQHGSADNSTHTSGRLLRRTQRDRTQIWGPDFPPDMNVTQDRDWEPPYVQYRRNRRDSFPLDDDISDSPRPRSADQALPSSRSMRWASSIPNSSGVDSDATLQSDRARVPQPRSPSPSISAHWPPTVHPLSRYHHTHAGVPNSPVSESGAERRRRTARAQLMSQLRDELPPNPAPTTASQVANNREMADVTSWGDVDVDDFWVPLPNTRPTSTQGPSMTMSVTGEGPQSDHVNRGAFSSAGLIGTRPLPTPPLTSDTHRVDMSPMATRMPSPSNHLSSHRTPAQQYEQMTLMHRPQPHHTPIPTSTEAAALFASSSSEVEQEGSTAGGISTDHPFNASLISRARRRASIAGTNIFPSTSPHARDGLQSNQSQTGSRRNIDLNDGPFHASLRRFVDIDRMRSRVHEIESNLEHSNDSIDRPLTASRSNPPSLPPLSFEHRQSPEDYEPLVPGLSSLPPRSSAFRQPDISSSRPVEGRPWRRTDMGGTSTSRPTDSRPYETPSVYSAPPRDYIWPGLEVHNVLTRQPRTDAERVVVEESSRGEERGLNQALDVLRGDGLSSTTHHHMMDRFQRERRSERREHSPDFAGFWNPHFDSSIPPSAPEHLAWRRRDRSNATFRSEAPFGGSVNSRGQPTSRRSASSSPTRDASTDQERVTARVDRTARSRRFAFRRDPDSLFGEFGYHPPPFRRRARNFGDYVRDEDFDASYENLLSIANTLGEARPPGVPEHIITSLPRAAYKDWATTESDKRCPICLDDYKPSDPVLRLHECPHWLHKDCLEQWLRGANTCPVCRKRVKGCRRHSGSNSNQEPGPSGGGSGSNRRNNDDNQWLAGFRRLPSYPWRFS